MLGIVRDWYEARRVETRVRLAEARLLEHYADDAMSFVTRYRRPYVDRDDELIGLRILDPPHLLGRRSSAALGVLDKARRESRVLCRVNPFARNVVNQIVNHVVGRGFSIEFDDDLLDKKWDRLSAVISWARRRRAVVTSVLRDGESFLRRFSDDKLRFVYPEYVVPPRNDHGEMASGVRFADDGVDLETPESYNVRYDLDDEEVEAEDMFHVKDPWSDMDEPRGWPVMFDARHVMEDYEGWVNDRLVLNRIRASVALLRTRAGATQADLEAIASKIRTGTRTSSIDNKQHNYGVFRPGMVIDTDDRTKWEFLSPNLQSQDVAEDGRGFRLRIAAFFSLAEYVVTSDASNANFASTAVAEAPSVKAMESVQDYFGVAFSEIAARLIGVDVARDGVVVKVTFPSLVTRDTDKEVRALKVEHDSGVVSTETWRERRGYDNDVEEARIEAAGSKVPSMITNEDDDLMTADVEDELDAIDADAA